MKILFVCKNRTFYGQTWGLINSASFVANYINSIGHEANVVIAEDANSIDRIVTKENPDIVIIEALWVTPEKMKEILAIPRHKNRKAWIIRLHSKLSFLSNEGIAFDWLSRYSDIDAKNLFIAPNVEELANFLSDEMRIRCLYLPNIYMPEDYKVVSYPLWGLNIGCFGAIRPMKNQLTQAAAAIKYANNNLRSLYFHVNSTRAEQGGASVLKNLRAMFNNSAHTLVEHPWVDHKKFVQIIRSMDLCLQVSLSETYNIVSADAISNGVPVVGSKEIPWLPSMFTVDPNSIDDIVNGISFGLSFRGRILTGLSRVMLARNNSNAKRIWENLINKN